MLTPGTTHHENDNAPPRRGLLSRMGFDLEPVLMWAYLILFLSGGVYIFIWMQASDAWRFTGALVNVNDTNAYMMFIEQYRQSPALLTRVLFTTEAPEPFVINLGFWLTGRLSALTHLPPMLVFHLLRIVCALLAFQFLWRLIGLHFDNRFWQYMAMLFILFNLKMPFSDWPPFTYELGGSRYWYGTRNLFLKCHYHPMYAIIAALLTGMFYTLARPGVPHVRRAAIGALVCAAIGLIHHYDFPMAYGILVIYIILSGHEMTARERWVTLTIALSPATVMAYQAWLAYSSPVGLEMAEHDQGLYSPGLYLYLYGIPLASAMTMAAVEIWRILRRPRRIALFTLTEKSRFAAACALAMVAVLLLPVGLKGRFMQVLEIPMMLLGVAGIRLLCARLPRKWGNGLAVALCAICAIPTFVHAGAYAQRNYLGFHRTTPEDAYRPYLSALPGGVADALEWIKANTPKDAVIVAPYHVANYIPGTTCRHVWVGHGFMTPDSKRKDAAQQVFYFERDPERHSRFLEITKADYVVDLLQWFNAPASPPGFAQAAKEIGCEPLMANDWIAIYSAQEFEDRFYDSK